MSKGYCTKCKKEQTLICKNQQALGYGKFAWYGNCPDCNTNIPAGTKGPKLVQTTTTTIKPSTKKKSKS